MSAEDQPQRSRNRRRPTLESGPSLAANVLRLVLRAHSRAPGEILAAREDFPWHGRPAPASSSSIPLPQIPLPNSAVLQSGSVPRRPPNHACPAAAGAVVPGAGRWQFPPLPAFFPRCDWGPDMRRFRCGSAALCSWCLGGSGESARLNSHGIAAGRGGRERWRSSVSRLCNFLGCPTARRYSRRIKYFNSSSTSAGPATVSATARRRCWPKSNRNRFTLVAIAAADRPSRRPNSS